MAQNAYDCLCVIRFFILHFAGHFLILGIEALLKIKSGPGCSCRKKDLDYLSFKNFAHS